VAADVVSLGRSPVRQAEAVRVVAASLPGPARASVFRLSKEKSLEILRNELGRRVDAPGEPDEWFAADPWIQLAADPSLRSVVCLSEEGTAGVLSIDGPLE
jgi:hypothetical protein